MGMNKILIQLMHLLAKARIFAPVLRIFDLDFSHIYLYLMNQKGWTNYSISSDSAIIKEKINLGAKYLFIYDKETYKEQGIQPFIKNKIGKFMNIEIYKL